MTRLNCALMVPDSLIDFPVESAPNMGPEEAVLTPSTLPQVHRQPPSTAVGVLGSASEERRRRLLAAIAPRLAQARLTDLIDWWNGRRGGVIVAFHDISSTSLARHLSLLAQMYASSLSRKGQALSRGRSTRGYPS